MPDCSGYGFEMGISLCVDSAVGNGEIADLTVTFTDINFVDAPIQQGDVGVSNWDGNRLELDITDRIREFHGFGLTNCGVITASLTIIPDGGTNTGTLLIEFTFDQCAANAEDYYAQIFENCGGAGPHVISEMATYTLDQAATCVG